MYIGQWKTGKKHGQGLWFYEDGDYVEVHWKNDKNIAENGVLMPNNDYYEGEIVGLRKHGEGKIFYGNITQLNYMVEQAELGQ